MSGEIRVHVVQEKDRKNLTMRYRDPITGKQVKRSAETANRKKAMKKAAQWEAELNRGLGVRPGSISWDSFRERYETEHASSLASSTQHMIGSVLNALERIVPPRKLADVNETRISKYQAALRREGKS